LDTEHIIIPAT